MGYRRSEWRQIRVSNLQIFGHEKLLFVSDSAFGPLVGRGVCLPGNRPRRAGAHDRGFPPRVPGVADTVDDRPGAGRTASRQLGDLAGVRGACLVGQRVALFAYRLGAAAGGAGNHVDPLCDDSRIHDVDPLFCGGGGAPDAGQAGESASGDVRRRIAGCAVSRLRRRVRRSRGGAAGGVELCGRRRIRKTIRSAAAVGQRRGHAELCHGDPVSLGSAFGRRVLPRMGGTQLACRGLPGGGEHRRRVSSLFPDSAEVRVVAVFLDFVLGSDRHGTVGSLVPAQPSRTERSYRGGGGAGRAVPFEP